MLPYNIYYYAEIHEKFNKTNIFWISHTEQKIDAIIRASIFCVDKTCFPRPSDKYNIPGYMAHYFANLNYIFVSPLWNPHLLQTITAYCVTTQGEVV